MASDFTTSTVYISDPSGRKMRTEKDHAFITKNMHDTVKNELKFHGISSIRHAASDMINEAAPLEGYSGLILMGGYDIDSMLYHGSTSKYSSYARPEVDFYEMELIYDAVRNNIPILGICRGMQLLNVAYGGTLHNDIGHLQKHKHNNFGGRVYEDQAIAHPVLVNTESLVLKAGEYSVASSHHQAVDELGEGLTITGYSDDGIIEMIEDVDNKVIGVQWHPESAHIKQSNTLSSLIAEFLTMAPEFQQKRQLVTATS